MSPEQYQATLVEKIAAAKERLAYLEGLRSPVPGVAELALEVSAEIAATMLTPVKRGPGRPRKT